MNVCNDRRGLRSLHCIDDEKCVVRQTTRIIITSLVAIYKYLSTYKIYDVLASLATQCIYWGPSYTYMYMHK